MKCKNRSFHCFFCWRFVGIAAGSGCTTNQPMAGAGAGGNSRQRSALPAGEEAALEYDFLPVTSPSRGWCESPVEHPSAADLDGRRPLVSPGRPASRRFTWPYTWKASVGCRPSWRSKRLFRSGSILTARRFPSPARTGRKAEKKLPADPDQRQTPADGQSDLTAGCGQELSAAGRLEKQAGFRRDPIAVSLVPDRRSGMEDVLNTVNINECLPGPGREQGGGGPEPAPVR